MIASTLPYEHSLSDEQVDALNQCIETIRLELSGGRSSAPVPNEDRAIAAIQRFMVYVSNEDTVNRRTPVAALFDVRTSNTLESYGITTIGALLDESQESLSRIPNLGPGTIDLIRVELGVFNLHLSGEKISVSDLLG